MKEETINHGDIRNKAPVDAIDLADRLHDLSAQLSFLLQALTILGHEESPDHAKMNARQALGAQLIGDNLISELFSLAESI